MKRFNARTLLSFTTEQLFNILTGEFELLFDDGEIRQVTARETIYSSYAWDFHREFVETPMLVKHHVHDQLIDKRLGSDTHLILLGDVMWSTYYAYEAANHPNRYMGMTEHAWRDMLSRKVYETTNVMYNELSYKLEAYVTSIDVLDFSEIVNSPRVYEANTIVQTTDLENISEDATPRLQKLLDTTYATVTDVLLNDPSMDYNPIAIACRSRIANMAQVLQCVSARGFLTDGDSWIFKKVPVMRGYYEGIRTFVDSLVESRSATKSLMFSKTPLQQAEYFSRRLQLMAQNVQHLHHTDCGTTEYLSWYVRPALTVDGEKIHNGDFEMLLGKFYMGDDGVLTPITRRSKHIIGKTVKLRSVLHCAHDDSCGICSTCFGQLSLSIPENTNIGQICCVTLAAKSSQSVMSVKHSDSSSKVKAVELSEDYKKFLAIASDNNSYILNSRLKGKGLKLIVPVEQAINLPDVSAVKEIGILNITRVSEITNMVLRIDDHGAVNDYDFIVKDDRRLASLTYPLLEYAKLKGWTTDEYDNYVIDLSDWDITKPFMTLPLRHINMSDHSRDIASMLESSVSKMAERDKDVSPTALLAELFELVNDKLKVNLAVLEVVLYSSMIISAETGDYALPKPWTDQGVGVSKLSMENRSLAAKMAFQGHQETITEPESYTNTNRLDHPFDYILMPRETILANKR